MLCVILLYMVTMPECADVDECTHYAIQQYAKMVGNVVYEYDEEEYDDDDIDELDDYDYFEGES